MKKLLAFLTLLFLAVNIASAQSVSTFSPFKLSSTVISPTNASWTFKLPYLGGSGTRCVQVDNTGLFAVSSAACGTGSGSSSGNVATSTADTATQVTVFTSTNATPATIGGFSGFTYSSSLTKLSVPYASTTGVTASKFFGALVGNADTATALFANGTNCIVGNYPLGVDASGNAETCTALTTGLTSYDAWTHPAAGISATTSQITVAGLLSTASSTFVSATRFPSLSQGIAYIGSTGLLGTAATSSFSLSQFTNDLQNLTATNNSLTFSGNYNGSAARTVGLNLGNANIWTVLQSFNYSSSTAYSSFVTASSTNLFTGFLTLSTTTAGCLNTSALGVVYAATCSSGGSGTVNSGAAGALAWYPSAGTAVSATGTQITVGNINATSTSATSTFAAAVAITANQQTGTTNWNSNEGTVNINNDNSNYTGLQVTSSVGSPQSAPLVMINTSNAAFDQPSLYINSASTQAANSGVRIDQKGFPCLVFVDTSSDNNSGAGKYQFCTHNQIFRFEGRDGANGSFIPDMVVGRQGATSTEACSSGRIGMYTGFGCGSARLELVGTSTLPYLYISSFLNGVGSGDIFSILASGNAGFGTSTPVYPLTSASSTKPQLALSSGAGVSQWAFRVLNDGTLALATTTTAGTATSSASVFRIDANGFPIFSSLSGVGCGQFDATGKLTNTGSACGSSGSGITALGSGYASTTATAVTFSTSTLSFNGLTLGQTIVPTAGALTFTPTVTGTLNNSGLTNSTIALSDSNSTLTIGGTPAALGGTLTATLNLAHANTWSVLQTFNYSSSTAYSSFVTASTTNLIVNGQSVNNLAGTGLAISGNALTSTLGTSVDLTSEVTGTLPVSKGGTNVASYPANSIITSDSAGTSLIATGTQLTVGNILATTTARNIFKGGMSIGTTTTYNLLGTSGDVNIAGLVTIGSTTPTAVAQIPEYALQVAGSQSDYVGISIMNLNPNGSADFVANGASTTETSYYFDCGMNGPNYSNATYSGFNRPNQGYCYSTDGGIAQAIGTTTATSYFNWLTGGYLAANERMRLDQVGRLMVGTTTQPMAQVTSASTTVPQLSLSYGAGVNQWVFRNESNGDLDIATTTVAGTATTSTAALTIKTASSPGVSIGSSSPFATLSVNPVAGGYSAQFAVGSSSANSFYIDNSSHVFAPNTTSASSAQTGYWCYDSSGQFIRDSAVCLVSALKFKTDVKDLTLGLDDLMKLRPVTYLKKDPIDETDSHRQMGFIADEVASASPELSEELVTFDASGAVHGFRYEQFTALITKSVQELNKKVDGVKRGAEENWQWLAISLLLVGMCYQQVQIKKLKK